MKNEKAQVKHLTNYGVKQLENACRAFILHDRKILLCKQKNPMRNFWMLPGGSIKEGETLVECLKREIFEEIGINLQIEQMLFVRELIDSSRHRIEFYFSVKELEDSYLFDEIEPCNEIEEAKFFTLEELSDLKLKPICLPDLVKEIIEGESTFPRYLGNVD